MEEEFASKNGMAFYQQDITEMLKMYNFEPMGSSTTAVKEVRIQQVMQAFQLFNNDQYINQMELRKMVLDAMDIKNVNKLLQQPPMPNAQINITPGQGGPQPPGPGTPMPPPGPPGPGQGAEGEAGLLANMMQQAGGANMPGPPGIPG